MNSKVMFSIPYQLVIRMKASISTRDRSKVVTMLLENEIKRREEHLYLCAKELEEDSGLRDEMKMWENTFGLDGLDGNT